MFLTPMDFLSACVSASVLLISRLNISDPPKAVNGVPSPNVCAIPIAIAVLPEHEDDIVHTDYRAH